MALARWAPTARRRRLTWFDRLWWIPTAASSALFAIHTPFAALWEVVGTFAGSLVAYAGISTWARERSAQRKRKALPFAVGYVLDRKKQLVSALHIAFAQPLEGPLVDQALGDIQHQVPHAVVTLSADRTLLALTRLPWGVYDFEGILALLDGWGRQLHLLAPIARVTLA